MVGTLAAVAAILSSPATAAVARGASDDGRWFADQGDGTYANPILVGDYSDPDVTRVGEDFYLVSSSFTEAPGLPILHSRDLVNWSIIGHALPRLAPDSHYATPRRGGGVWAPALRFRNGRFLLYYPDPDRGIFLLTAKDPAGPWSAPSLVDDTPGIIDPAPFWDDDGTGWLAYAYAHSRSGRANIIALKRLNDAGDRTDGSEQVIIDGNTMGAVATSLGPRPWQTTEGPKLYKRDGYYYVFAPSGSVKGGWQAVFRSRSIQGPYEGRNVMDQGATSINGPHQGAWITTAAGEDWFFHFQDRDSYGRVVHMQPMRWRDGWPVIGVDADGDGRGEPVLRHKLPKLPHQGRAAPLADDDFSGPLSLAWQFGSNPAEDWWAISGGQLRLKSVTGSTDLYETGAILSQKFPALRFRATTSMRFRPLRVGERAGLAVHGKNFAWIGLRQDESGAKIVQMSKASPDPSAPIEESVGPVFKGENILLRLDISPVTIDVPPPAFTPYWPSMLSETHALVRMSYSVDGKIFVPLGKEFRTLPGRWVGAQIGLFAQAANGSPAATATSVGGAAFDWFRVQ